MKIWAVGFSHSNVFIRWLFAFSRRIENWRLFVEAMHTTSIEISSPTAEINSYAQV